MSHIEPKFVHRVVFLLGRTLSALSSRRSPLSALRSLLSALHLQVRCIASLEHLCLARKCSVAIHSDRLELTYVVRALDGA